MPQFQWARIAALAAAFVLGGVGVGAVGQQLEEPQDEPATASTATSPVDATQPFLQDTVTFRSTPGARSLLLGDEVQAQAVAILDRPCTGAGAPEEDEAVAAGGPPAPPVRVLAVPDYASSAPRDVSVQVTDAASVTGDDVIPLPACPLRLAVTLNIDHPQGGSLVTAEKSAGTKTGTPAEDTDAPSRATKDVLVPYTLTHYISASGYWLLAISALAVALIGGLLTAREGNFVVRVQKDEQPSYPVMAGVAAALTAVSGGTIVWSDLVPTLHLAGVTVILLVAGVFVTMGETLVNHGKAARAGIGHAFRLFGTATLALLPVFVLLHGASIGAASLGVWIGLVALLCWVAVLIVPGDE